MRKFVLFLGAFLLLAGTAAAQDTPWADLFAGYSFVHVSSGSSSSTSTIAGVSGGSAAAQSSSLLAGAGDKTLNLHGGSFNIAGNLSKWLGIVADVGVSKIDQSFADGTLLTYMFGPRISYRKHERYTPFAHVLIGGARLRVKVPINAVTSTSQQRNALAFGFGGGLDAKLGGMFSARVAQVEYLLTRFGNGTSSEKDTQNSVRVSGGLVINFGKR